MKYGFTTISLLTLVGSNFKLNCMLNQELRRYEPRSKTSKKSPFRPLFRAFYLHPAHIGWGSCGMPSLRRCLLANWPRVSVGNWASLSRICTRWPAWSSRVTEASTRWARAIVMRGSPGMIRTNYRIQPAESILLCMSSNSSGPWLSRQDVVDSDLAALPAVDHHGDLLTGREVLPGRITGRPRIGVDLDPAVDQVDDPVNGDAAAPIEVPLLAIGTHVRRRHCHQQPHVGRLGDPMPIVGIGTPDDRDVRFWLVIRGDPHRLFLPPRPPGR